MTPTPPTARPMPGATKPAAPGALPAVLAAPRSAEVLAAEQWRIRLSFAQPVFGPGEHAWQFVCDGKAAEELAQGLMERRTVRLAFPENTVILDTAHVVYVDFQPYPA